MDKDGHNRQSQEESSGWLTVKQVADREVVSKRTIYRWIESGKFETRRIGGQWRLRYKPSEESTPAKVDEKAHQRFLLDLIEDCALELARFREPFPSIWKFPYRLGDPSSGLRVVTSRNVTSVDWTLSTEREDNWPLALSHLSTGDQDAYHAYQTVKSSWGQYWLRLSQLHDAYRDRARRLVLNPDLEDLDHSHFYRSILDEVDEDASDASEADYLIERAGPRFRVSFREMGLVSVADEEIAQTWSHRHLEWRREFVKEHKPRLVQLRRDAKAAADGFAKFASLAKARGIVPGRCDVCGVRS